MTYSSLRGWSSLADVWQGRPSRIASFERDFKDVWYDIFVIFVSIRC